MIVLHICILVATIVLTVVLCRIYFNRRTRRKVSYMLDALEDGEINFRFGRGSLFDKSMNRTLNRLRDIFDREMREIHDKERFYGRLLDNAQTGIVTVDTASGQVNYANHMALNLLGMYTISSLRQFANIDPALFEAFSKVQAGSDAKVSYYTERGQRSLSLSASQDNIGGHDIKIIAFNDISSALEENENESWTRLIRVLTHEIMNTVIPIASLSEALQDVSGDELQAGLETISVSSRSLIRFVESYRSITRVATPVRKAFYVRELAQHVLELAAPQILEAGASASFEEKQEDILLYADEGQIRQILVNLVKNALQAGARKVLISADIDRLDRVVINVANDGEPISPQSQEQIFVPFYTTKSDGTGIGLSLSRQIMRMHGGSIRLLRSDERQTIFSLIFP